jgi:hypothetical protein
VVVSSPPALVNGTFVTSVFVDSSIESACPPGYWCDASARAIPCVRGTCASIA